MSTLQVDQAVKFSPWKLAVTSKRLLAQLPVCQTQERPTPWGSYGQYT